MEEEGSKEELGESKMMLSLFGGSADGIRVFFDDVWQRNILHKSLVETPLPKASQSIFSDAWDPVRMKDNPLEELLEHGWDVLIHLLEQSRPIRGQEMTLEPPILFRDQTLVSPSAREDYQQSLFAAYLDGCSVVINHSDVRSPWIGALCEDLQKTFPHAYANTYITPPNSQTVSAHADDRDVLVIQVLGKKEWTVYQRIPVPHPYPPEQVGKEGRPVPPPVLEGPQHTMTLRPGDMLYLPRGFVHEARSAENQMSFHITVALATHDWSLAGILATTAGSHLRSVLDFRLAVPRDVGTRPSMTMATKHLLERQIKSALKILQEEWTPQMIHQGLEQKFRHHNERAARLRQDCLHAMLRVQPTNAVVGRAAERQVTLGTVVRVAKADEKASVQTQKRHGLMVQETTMEALLYILDHLRSNMELFCRIEDLVTLCNPELDASVVCPLTLLSFARRCVELGALAVVKF